MRPQVSDGRAAIWTPWEPNEAILSSNHTAGGAGDARGSRIEPSRSVRARVGRTSELLIEWVIRACGVSAVIFVFGIFYFVFREAAPLLFGGLDYVQFVGSPAWYPDSEVNARYGALALIAGTVSVTLLATLLAIPLGLGAAVYVSEFCTGRLKETLKVVVELLAAIPSVVWGFIGLMILNPIIIDLLDAPVGLNILNGALLLALMSVPIMVSIGEDALKAVPDTYREAAVAMGATRWQTTWRVLLPAARNGLLAAVLLGVGRAIGETMAVLMATGHAVNIPTSPLDSVRTITATIAAELGETARGSDHYRILFVLGTLLFLLTFMVNLIADVAVRGVRQR
ncbi:MAG: phosphate ABC transporter permease subunit PstC [Proteobacteria bacterium]|nr:phosphate ABC transporter permease subunit PstC [Pseudomonadota bacterium]